MVTNDKDVTLVKGKAIASIPKFIVKKFGKKGLQRWFDAISAGAHQIFIFPVKPDEWYPVRTAIIEPSANIAQLFYDWDIKKAAWEMGRFSADYGLGSVSRMIVRMGPSGYLVKKSSEILNSYYKPITADTIDITPNSGILRIKDLPGIEKTLEFRISGWMERALEISGCKNIKINIAKSLTEGHPYTEFRVSWE